MRSPFPIGPVAHRTVDVEQIADDVRVLWIDPQDLVIVGHCLLPATLPPFNGGNIPRHRAVVRQKHFRNAELSQRICVIAVEPIVTAAEHVMGFSEIRLQLQRDLRFGACPLLPCVSRLVKMVDARAGRREPCMCEREIWIERDCLDVKLLSCAIVLQEGIGLEFVLPGLKIKLVCLGVIRWFASDARLLLGR